MTTGFFGSSEIFITCLRCGNKFKPGIATRYSAYSAQENHDTKFGFFLLVMIVIFLVGLSQLKSYFSKNSSKQDTVEPQKTVVAPNPAKAPAWLQEQEQRAARQKYVDDLQETFNSDPQGQGIQIAQGNNELLFTAEAVRGASPQMIRSMWASKFGDQEKKNLCGIGFRGLRARADAKSPGTFISFGCGNKSAK